MSMTSCLGSYHPHLRKGFPSYMFLIVEGRIPRVSISEVGLDKESTCIKTNALLHTLLFHSKIERITIQNALGVLLYNNSIVDTFKSSQWSTNASNG